MLSTRILCESRLCSLGIWQSISAFTTLNERLKRAALGERTIIAEFIPVSFSLNQWSGDTRSRKGHVYLQAELSRESDLVVG
jgi:hypothetical protein